MSRTRSALAVLLATSLTLGSLPAWGQKGPPNPPPAPSTQPPPSAPSGDEVARLKQQGNDAMAAFRPADALVAYQKAYALSKDPALLYNMGGALERLGDFPAALENYEEFSRVAPAEMKARVPKLAQLLADTRQKVSVVIVTCNVLGARVTVGDKTVGEIPSSGSLKKTLNSGPATIEVSAEGYAPVHKQVVFEKGAIGTFDFSLVRKEQAGTLAIQTTPPGEVFVDNKPVGRSPVEATLSGGTHKVVVRREGFDDVETSAVVEPETRKEITIDLEKRPAITTRWWFWTGVAVVVVGGVVLTYALLTERSADSGTIKPGQGAAPLLRF